MKIFTEMTTDKVRVCKCCGRELPIEKFPTNARYEGMKGQTCHDCVTAKKRETARKRAEFEAQRRAERAERQIAHVAYMNSVKAIFEAQPEGCEGLAQYTTKALLDELRKRNCLYNNLAADYREIYEKR